MSESDMGAGRKIRVMVLGLRGFPGVQGGIETHAQHLYPRMLDQCDIQVLARAHYVASSQTEWNGIAFTRLWSPVSTGVEAFVHTFIGVLYAAVRRPDILHIHAIGPGLMVPLARMFGLNVVLTHHGRDYDRQKWGRFAKWLLRKGESLGVGWANAYITVARYLLDGLKSRGYVRGEYIPNGVEIPSAESDTSVLETFGLQPGRYVLLVARMVPEKRHADLIEAFRQVKLDGRKLVIVGDHRVPGEYADSIRRLAAAEDVVLTGFQTGSALAALYSNAEMFVLPSSHEGLPIALLEALSYGLHVIASDIPAHLELELNESHYFKLGDVEGLSRRLAEAPDGGLDGESRAEQLRYLSRSYDWQTIAGQTCRLYRDVLGRS